MVIGCIAVLVVLGIGLTAMIVTAVWTKETIDSRDEYHRAYYAAMGITRPFRFKDEPIESPSFYRVKVTAADLIDKHRFEENEASLRKMDVIEQMQELEAGS